MGYQLPRRTARIKFEGTYEGAEAVLSLNVPIGQLLEMSNLRDAGEQKSFFEFMAARVLEWNVEDTEGKPIATDYDGFMKLDDPGFLDALADAWLNAMTSADVPLGKPSTDGKPPDALVDVLLESQVS